MLEETGSLMIFTGNFQTHSYAKYHKSVLLQFDQKVRKLWSQSPVVLYSCNHNSSSNDSSCLFNASHILYLIDMFIQLFKSENETYFPLTTRNSS